MCGPSAPRKCNSGPGGILSAFAQIGLTTKTLSTEIIQLSLALPRVDCPNMAGRSHIRFNLEPFNQGCLKYPVIYFN